MRTYLGPRDERGASAVEYGLLVASIALVCMVVVFTLGRSLSTVFDNQNSIIESCSGCSAP